MTLRNQFIKHVGPGGMSGCTLGEWLAHLQQNRFAISPRYWPRVAMTTFNSVMNSTNMRRERQYDAEVEAVDVPPPLIVLGIWRSGTTHLHNLLSKDHRYAFPNTFQALFPNTFLTTEEKTASLLNSFMTPERPMDNVKQDCSQPQEDEFALVPAGLSYVCGFAFPKTGDDYWRFLTLRDTTTEEKERWSACRGPGPRRLPWSRASGGPWRGLRPGRRVGVRKRILWENRTRLWNFSNPRHRFHGRRRWNFKRRPWRNRERPALNGGAGRGHWARNRTLGPPSRDRSRHGQELGQRWERDFGQHFGLRRLKCQVRIFDILTNCITTDTQLPGDGSLL